MLHGVNYNHRYNNAYKIVLNIKINHHVTRIRIVNLLVVHALIFVNKPSNILALM